MATVGDRRGLRCAQLWPRLAQTSGSRTTAEWTETTSDAGDVAPPPGPLCPPYSRPPYGWGAGAKPDGVVAVTVGVATLVSGAGGGVVVVTVCSVACGATGPTTCAGSAELTSPKIAPSAPMATTALTPIVADPNFHCAAVTLTTPFGR